MRLIDGCGQFQSTGPVQNLSFSSISSEIEPFDEFALIPVDVVETDLDGTDAVLAVQLVVKDADFQSSIA